MTRQRQAGCRIRRTVGEVGGWRRRLRIEVLETRRLLAADYGDLPSPYPTLLASGGAEHEAIGAMLGATRTAESDGQPSGLADADQGDDGVVFGAVRAGDLDALATVQVQDAPAGAVLDAWIDFNGDGVFTSAGERIATGRSVHEGSNAVRFAVPSSAAAGATYARFRLSTSGVDSPGGDAADGEVEDYVVSVLPPRASDALFGPAVPLNNNELERLIDTVTVDADGDGDLDLYTISGDSVAPQNETYEHRFGLYLHENLGGDQFETRLLYALPEGILSDLEYGDFTGDGRPDFAAINTSLSRIEVLEQTPTGEYVARTSIASDRLATIEPGDFDGDGHLDLLGVDYISDIVSLYVNDGAGEFSAIALEGLSVDDVTVVDIDGDSDLDLAYIVTISSSSTLRLLVNDGSGAFSAQDQTLTVPHIYRVVAAGDLDADGDVDLFAGGVDLYRMENDGAESFTPHLVDADPLYRLLGQVVDIDQDGDADVVTTTRASASSSSGLSLYRSDGAGGYAREDLSTHARDVGLPEVVDYDANGRLDIVLSRSNAETISVFRQLADGRFVEQPLITALSGEFHATDLDQDGDLDLLARPRVPYHYSSALWWYEQTSPGAYAIRQLVTEFNVSGVDTLDMDGDGDLDILGSDYNSILWYENDGAQNFVRHTAFAQIETLWRYTPTDYDGDGDVDLLISNGDADVVDPSIRLLENDGQQNFTLRELTNLYHFSRAIVAADLDNDGDIDLFAGGSNQLAVVWFEQTADGSLTRHVIDDSSTSIRSAAVADLNADGLLDIVADAFYYLNDGAGGYDRYNLVTSHPVPYIQEIADLNGDGLPDIAASRTRQVNYQPYYENSFVWFRNLGAGQFASEEVFQAGLRSPGVLALGDMDGDGDLDGVFADSVIGEFWWQENLSAVNLEAAPSTLVEEHGGQAMVRLTRGGDNSNALSVQLTLGGSATYGVDYTLAGAESIVAQLASVEFPAAVDEVTLVLTPVDELEIELEETITMALVAPAGYVLPGAGQAEITLVSLDLLGDYGDAPESYGTSLADDGARHLAVGPTLGEQLTEEFNGAAAPDANGDEGDDGLQLAPLQAGGAQVTWQAAIANSPSGALLDAWVDFNADGVWDDASERVARGVPVAEGTNPLGVAAPANSAIGQTYVRVRVSTQGVSTPYGVAADGEVEDYAVTILPPVEASRYFGAPAGVSSQTMEASDLLVGDFSGDGEPDALVADLRGNRVLLLESQHDAADGATELFAAPAPGRIATADFLRDGLPDVVVLPASSSSPLTLHVQQPSGEFTAYPIGSLANASDLAVSDVDRDGDADILVANGQTLVLYRNDGGLVFSAVEIAADVKWFEPVDFNGDGRLDLVAASESEVFALVQSADGAYQPAPIGAFDDARDVATADLDGDGDRDVWVASGDGATVFERLADGGYEARTLPSSAWLWGNTLADFDGDGDIDMISAGRNDSLDALDWLENLGGFNFARHEVAGFSNTLLTAAVADWNGDGQLDVLAATDTPDQVVVALAAPAVSVVASTPEISEASRSSAELLFTRLGNLTAELSVDIQVAGFALVDVDYAVAGADYWSDSEARVVFPAGESEVVVTLTALDDTLVELDEAIQASIPSTPTLVTLAPSTAIVTLVSDEYGGDFGDAPAPYPTRLAESGAAHQPQGPLLGPTRGASVDAMPEEHAAGDADDDGVVWGDLRVGQTHAVVTLDVRNAAAGAVVDAWIDFNQDGSWGSPGEHVVAAQSVEQGLYDFYYEVPAWAAAGETFARVRISSTGAHAPGGLARDGEVEDYALIVASPVATTPQFARETLIREAGVRSYPSEIVPVDFDGDGDLDVLAGGGYVSLSFYENQGAAGYVQHSMLPNDKPLPQDLTVVDFDRDGDLDVVYRGSFGLWWLETLEPSTFAHHALPAGASVDQDVVGDFDSDGGPDVVTLQAEANGASVALIRRTSDGAATIDELASIPMYRPIDARLVSADFNGDGRLDVVAAWRTGQVDSEIVLLEGDGHGSLTPRTLVAVEGVRLLDLAAADVDADGDIDLVARLNGTGETTRLAWWEQTATGDLLQHAISTPYAVGEPVVADLNGDGLLDIVAVRQASNPRRAALPDYAQFLAWLNAGDGAFTYTVDPALPPLRSGSSLGVGDADQDGDLDLFALDSTGALAWHRNLSAVSGDYDRNGVVDLADYDVWRSSYGGGSGVALQADGNDDGVVNAADYTVWRDNLPQSLPTPVAPAEESNPVVTAVEREVVGAASDVTEAAQSPALAVAMDQALEAEGSIENAASSLATDLGWLAVSMVRNRFGRPLDEVNLARDDRDTGFDANRQRESLLLVSAPRQGSSHSGRSMRQRPWEVEIDRAFDDPGEAPWLEEIDALFAAHGVASS